MRTLPLRPSPAPGESFASYVDRIAASLEAPLTDVLQGTGLMRLGRAQDLQGYGITLRTPVLRRFSDAVRLPEEEVAGMLLIRYRGGACDLSYLKPDDPASFRLAAVREWAYLSGSHVCPSCVAESGGAWKLRWKLPWSFACTRHGSLLADTCPGCRARIGYGKGTGPVLRSLVPTPFACRNCRPKGAEQHGNRPWRKVCGYPLEDSHAPTLRAWPRLLETQARLDAALEGGGTFSVAGAETPARVYFSDLKMVCSLILSRADAEALGGLPPSIFADVSARIRRRDEIRSLGIGVKIGRGGGRNAKSGGSQEHVSSQSSAMMSAVVPLAVEMLDAGSVAELSETLGTFVRRLHARKKSPPEAVAGYSGRLREAFLLSWRSNQNTSVRLGWHRGRKRREDPELSGLSPDLVPQLLWEEDFGRLFDGLLPKALMNMERRFCSMALVRLSGDYPWNEAAGELDLPLEGIAQRANLFVHHLNKGGRADVFGERLHGLARRVANDPDAVDYGSRRRRFSGFDLIPAEEWERICRGSGVHLGAGARRSYASAWVWSHLTGGDPLLSPAWARLSDSARMHRGDRFRTKVLGDLRIGLLGYCETMLGEGAKYHGKTAPIGSVLGRA